MKVIPIGFVLLPLLHLLSGCAPRSAPEAVPQPAVAEWVLGEIPEEVGGFQLIETHRFPDAAMGTAYRYQHASGLQSDVYLYPVTATARDVGDDPGDQTRAESELFKEVLPLQRAQRRFDDFEVLGDQPLRLSVRERRVVGWHVHAVISRQQQEYDTHQHVFAFGEHLVKFRTTYLRGSHSDDEVEAFIVSLLEAIT
jgi:hypothetical protein